MKLINLRGDLFATVLGVGATAVIRLVSALILTRLLYPEAYGVVAIVAAIATVVELISDIGVLGFVIRDKNAELPRYVNTLWTLRLIRGCANGAILYLAAPLLASLYGAALLSDAIRISAIGFVFMGLESMSFPLAIRHQRARVVSYSELASAFLSTCFVVAFSFYSRDHMGMIYGMVLNRLLLTASSYFFYRDLKLRLQLDREAVKDLFGFTKFVIPSSLFTLAIGQFDKVVFLRLFDLHTMGLYGLAGNMAGPVDSMISSVTRRVLYARCAQAFRNGRDALREAYYAQNLRLFALIMFLPAAVGGAADFIVELLFDERYASAGAILRAFMIQSTLLAFAASAEMALVAAGHVRVLLIANALRFAWMVGASLLGYYLAGLEGFLYGYVLSPLPMLAYDLWKQRETSLLVVKYELFKLTFVVVTFLAFLMLSELVSNLRFAAALRML